MKQMFSVLRIGALLALGITAISPHAQAGFANVYNTVPANIPPGVVSLSFGSNGIVEAGKLIDFSTGSPVHLTFANIVLGNYSYASGYPSYPSSGFTTPASFLAISFYNVNNDGSVGSKIAEFAPTTTYTIPWRPDPGTGSPPCQTAGAYRASDGFCYLDSTSVASFNFAQGLGGIDLPSRVIYSIRMDTVLDNQGHRIIDPNPGPWQGVNLGYTDSLPSTGTNPTQAISYLDFGTGFQAYSDPGLAGFSPMVDFLVGSADTPEPASISLAMAALGILLLNAKRKRLQA